MLAWNKKHKTLFKRFLYRVIIFFGHVVMLIFVLPMGFALWLYGFGEGMMAYSYEREIKHIKIKAGDKYFYLENGVTWELIDIRKHFFNDQEGGVSLKYKRDKDWSVRLSGRSHQYSIYIQDGMEIKLEKLEGE